MIDHAALKKQIETAFAFAQKQMRGTIERTPDFFPLYTKNGKWKHDGASWTDWCAGFHAGQMWLFAERTGDPYWREQAGHYSELIEYKKNDRDVHDLGFIFMSTWRRWLDLVEEGSEAWNRIHDVLIQAGRTLAMRFQEKGEYLSSFIGPESLFIDIMMNVRIIFYAARETNDADLLRVADRHCLTTRRVLVRGDGSTSHEGVYDRETGEFLKQTTHQGYRGDSCWSRGLAWSLYGFAICHEMTGEEDYLETAQSNADYWLENTPEHGVPPWDFDAPADGSKTSGDMVETSAGAIAASGLMTLAGLTPDPGRAAVYRQRAFNTIASLTTPEYLAIEDDGWEGILKAGIYHLHKDLGVNESVMWGEYFFLEAMLKVLDALD